ncbi:MAG TPA: hypothetical protein PKE49_12800, partial [Leptospiraceae bacterium]|nr:hypothetical protein [Leptospiraceae bacterium]
MSSGKPVAWWFALMFALVGARDCLKILRRKKHRKRFHPRDVSEPYACPALVKKQNFQLTVPKTREAVPEKI